MKDGVKKKKGYLCIYRENTHTIKVWMRDKDAVLSQREYSFELVCIIILSVCCMRETRVEIHMYINRERC